MPKKDITHQPDDRFSFTCQEPDCGFTSINWVTRALAEKRRDQHMAEHEGHPPVERPANVKG